jgi:PPM family protein phosphatase
MNDSIQEIVYGKQFETPNDIYCQTIPDSGIGFGISVGTIAKANEDCVGVSILGKEIILTIADGHWGKEASELAVTKAVEMLDRQNRFPKDNETRARLYALFEQINTNLFQMAMVNPGSPASETSLIVCYLRETPTGKYLFWSSFGDSYLFILNNGVLKQLNSLNPFWLGMLSKLSENAETKAISLKYLSGESRYVGVSAGLETGIEKLDPGEVVFLCTDGLIGSDDGVPESIADNIKSILSTNSTSDAKAHELIKSALMRGEKDNISCIVAHII